MAARKARKEQEVNRRAKEEAQQKILEDQSKLAMSNKPKDIEDIVIPDVVVPSDIIEVTVSICNSIKEAEGTLTVKSSEFQVL